jgi:TonB family protein
MVPSLKPPSQQPRTGVNTSAEPDFGPYVAELQRRIKRNWIPPSGTENKRIVAKFKIARDGRLVSVILSQPSGNALADAAALAAIRAAAPFRPLPTAFKKNDIEIQFIFDYNVFQNAKPIPGLSPKPRNTVDI